MTDLSLPPIVYDDLIKKLTDPESDLAYYLRYMIEVPVPGQMAPELFANPSLVTDIPPSVEGGVAMGLANWVMRGRRHRAYRDRLSDGWSGHRIVSEGDSWFQYPTKLQDIIDHLMRDHAILSLGAAGDELRDIQRQREIIVNLKAERASALLLSAGGNDLFDNGQMGLLVEEPFVGATADDLVGSTFNTFLRTILGRFLSIFSRVHTALPHVHILVHGYASAFPCGGAWIEGPLTERGVAPQTQHDVVKLMVKRFNAGLSQLAARPEFHGKIAHLNVSGVGGKRGDWHDEIHLNGLNSAKVADHFRLELRRRLSSAAPETGISALPPEPRAEIVARQAEALSAFDEATLLRELDLRVSLLEMDPTVAAEAQLAPLVMGQQMPEIGLASLHASTRRLIRIWENELRDLVCDSTVVDSGVGKAVIDVIDKGKMSLSGAIAGWLVTGPLAVPAVIASALAAVLASKLIAMGQDKLCEVWVADAPSTPALIGGTEGGHAQTAGEVRSRFDTPENGSDFSNDGQKAKLDLLAEAVAKDAVEAPMVPVDADGATAFLKNAATIFKVLGGETDDVVLSDAQFGSAEAMILIDGSRAAPYVQDGFVDLTDPRLIASGWKDKIVTHEVALRKFIAASGRIIRASDRSANQVYGSAWMLDGGRVATARHVLEEMAIWSNGAWHMKDLFYVDFAVEADRPVRSDRVFKISGVDWAGPDIIAGTVNPGNLDAAVLTLEPVDTRAFPDPVALTSNADAAAILDEEWFFNVGHPAQPWGAWLVDGDDGNDNTISKALVFALIGDRFGVKRLSPGRMEFKPGFFPGDDATKHLFTHDATTLGGSSGSAIMSTATGASICGLHFAGLFGTRNYAHFVPQISNNWG